MQSFGRSRSSPLDRSLQKTKGEVKLFLSKNNY
jgi:hypothetical protein